MSAKTCDVCGGEVWYTQYDLTLEEAVALEQKGIEPPIAKKLCRVCWSKDLDRSREQDAAGRIDG